MPSGPINSPTLFTTSPDMSEALSERDQAWIGDAVLALYVRSWILRQYGRTDGEMMVRFTSNQFLSSIGNPTGLEARVGRIYQTDGLEAAFAWIEEELLPRFQQREKKRKRKS